MNSFKTIREARAHAKNNFKAKYILEIIPGKAGIDKYICTTHDLETVAQSLDRKPIVEIKSVVRQVADIEQERRDKEQAEQKKAFEKAKKKGKAFRVVEITGQYGNELLWAAWMDEAEKEKYEEWFKNKAMVSLSGAPRIKGINTQAVLKVIGERKPDGMFRGCSNQVWIITQAEWNEIIKHHAKAENIRLEKQAEIKKQTLADIRHKVENGFCFSCESYCYGDCGNYSNDPMVKAKRDHAQAIKEMYFASND
jgi:hypothetical protein